MVRTAHMLAACMLGVACMRTGGHTRALLTGGSASCCYRRRELSTARDHDLCVQRVARSWISLATCLMARAPLTAVSEMPEAALGTAAALTLTVVSFAVLGQRCSCCSGIIGRRRARLQVLRSGLCVRG